jgi:multicomponent Na+:H+ antiporter subunit G
VSAVDVLSWVLLLAGSFFCVTGGIGLLRMPDFYTRAHAGGLTDTLGLTLIIAGLIVQAGLSLVAVKLVLIAAILHVTCPTGTHALVKAAYARGMRVKVETDQGDAARS